MPRRFPARRRPLRAPRFFHAPGRQPIEEFRDSSLFTLEIKNGIQFGTIDIVEGEVQYLDLAGLALRLELEPEFRAGSLLAGVFGSMQYARIDLAIVDGPAQPDLDALPGKTKKVGHAFERAVDAGRTHFEALVVDVFDFIYARQLFRHLLAVFYAYPVGPVYGDAQQPQGS